MYLHLYYIAYNAKLQPNYVQYNSGGLLLMSSLAVRVRKRRKQLGYTQADLAQRAGVSLRFLAQLESGKGNISVQRLADIASALTLSLGELFRGLGPQGPLVLALVGLRGAGKSTLGHLAAKHLSIPFVELDQKIVETCSMSLSEIFSFGGESYYHELQDRVLQDIFSSPKPMIIATGGSIVRASISWERLRNYAKTIWLYAKPESYLNRVYAQGDHRPMQGRDALPELKQLLKLRTPFYAQSDLHLDTDVADRNTLIQNIVDFYRSA